MIPWRPSRIVNEALLERILTSPSWSVEYRGDAYDDARSVDGVWYFRDLLTYEYETFPLQSGVVPLFENPANIPNIRFKERGE
jgi:hypothetical protein